MDLVVVCSRSYSRSHTGSYNGSLSESCRHFVPRLCSITSGAFIQSERSFVRLLVVWCLLHERRNGAHNVAGECSPLHCNDCRVTATITGDRISNWNYIDYIELAPANVRNRTRSITRSLCITAVQRSLEFANRVSIQRIVFSEWRSLSRSTELVDPLDSLDSLDSIQWIVFSG